MTDCTLQGKGGLLYFYDGVGMASLKRQLLSGLRAILPRQGDRSIWKWSVEGSGQGTNITTRGTKH